MARSILEQEILLSYYGDDFTGSTDVMESLTMNGIPAAMFLHPPSKEEVMDFRLKNPMGQEKIKAFGVAGISRSLSPLAMEEELPGIFEAISRISADFFQYKVCSTFDSSPEIGSIGLASEIALRYFPAECIPLVIGSPFLNRFVAFGNLFARVARKTYRLDRHPTMSRHPVTPMRESDLRLHLAQQTNRDIALMDIHALQGEYGPPTEVYQSLIEKHSGFVLFDTLDINHLLSIGTLLIEHKRKGTQLLVGSSGVNYALAFYLQKMGKIQPPEATMSPGKARKMAVIAGSCSPTTAAQINYMIKSGHQGIPIDTEKITHQEDKSSYQMTLIQEAQRAMDAGKVPLFYTALGPEDPVIQQTRESLKRRGWGEKRIGQALAEAMGSFALKLMETTGRIRLVVAGGDTSGYVARSLGINALEILCPIAPGAPLCLAHSHDSRFDGMEISLKGGQNGNEKYFESILEGKLLNGQ
ncbi:MAG: four-carbon acid sugar kinase family protein [Cyclobacteriaceae bacterium]|nr:four-carbon acid sugar kinase family protein [Cyclobacteriaceae bacterium]